VSREYRLRAALCALLVACGGAESSDAPTAPPPADAGAFVTEDDGFVGCPESIPMFVLGMGASGDNGVLAATLDDASHAPPLRYLNDWTLHWTRSDGTPLADVVLTKARAFMPVHGHDGIVPPTIEPLAEPGRVRVRGLNFNMRGPWEVQLWLSSASAGDDYVVFHICVQE
jgi:hypothetical protein